MPSIELREVIGDWLMVFGAIALLVSLFLTWSHQLSGAFGAQWRSVPALATVPRNPTAWQVYSIADVLLLAVVAAVLYVAAVGSRRARSLVLAALVPAFVFVLHARAHAPTNGVNVALPGHATAGAGETVALIALATAAAGLLVSFTAD